MCLVLCCVVSRYPFMLLMRVSDEHIGTRYKSLSTTKHIGTRYKSLQRWTLVPRSVTVYFSVWLDIFLSAKYVDFL